MTDSSPGTLGVGAADLPEIRTITFSDIGRALAKGASDFWARPSHYVFVGIIYVAVGIALALWTSGANAFQLLFPLAAGFALVGPVAALGLYEISRRRELEIDSSARSALAVLRSPAIGQIVIVGLMLAAIFLVWLWTAQTIYWAYYGMGVPESFWGWVVDLFTTGRGWGLIVVGNVVGAVFALIVLSTTVVAFPYLIDRGGSAGQAIATSWKAVRHNPAPMLGWGVVVALGLFVGSIPLFVGLAVVIPILGHATWHLYRAVVA